MTSLSQLLDMSAMQAADDTLGKFGIPAVCVPLVNKYDFDPDHLYSTLETVNSIVAEVRTAAGALTEPIGGDDCWEGQGRDQADEYRECVASWWQQILDFLLGLVDWLIQILDWIMEFLHFVAGWIVYLAGWIGVFFAGWQVLVWVGLLATMPEVVATIATVIGVIAAAALVLGGLTWLLDRLFDLLLDLISKGRDKLCGGDVIPRVPHNDPFPPIPTWPF